MDLALILALIAEKFEQIHNNIPQVYGAGLEKGKNEGREALYNEFWNAYLNNSNGAYTFAGYGWNDTTFVPNRNIWPTYIHLMFANSAIVDIVGCLNRLGRVINTSKAKIIYYIMRDNTYSQNLFEIDTTSCGDLSYFIYNCSALHTIKNVKLKTDGSQLFNPTYSFGKLPELVNIHFSGIIGQNGVDLSGSKKLSKASLKNIVQTLSTSTYGKFITLPLEAVNKAFETSEGANDGAESEEWALLQDTRVAWTVALI